MPRIVPALACAWCVAATALGDSLDADRNQLTSLHVTRDDATGQSDYARLTIHDRSAADAGRAVWTCADHQPTPHFNVLVFDARPPDSENQIRTDAVRLRVDSQPWRRFDAVLVFDRPAREATPPSTGTGPVTPTRGFLDELIAGERLAVQVGGLRPLPLDLATARPDIVSFKRACDQMYQTLMRSPQRWASPGLEFLDPVTDRGQLALNLFHEASHDGGDQPRFFVHCANHEDGHGVNLGMNLPRALHRATVAHGAAPTLLIHTDADPAGQFQLTNDMAERWTTFHLPPHRRPPQEFLQRLARAHTMTLRFPDLPVFRVDLAGARPEITTFSARCDALLRLPSVANPADQDRPPR